MDRSEGAKKSWAPSEKWLRSATVDDCKHNLFRSKLIIHRVIFIEVCLTNSRLLSCLIGMWSFMKITLIFPKVLSYILPIITVLMYMEILEKAGDGEMEQGKPLGSFKKIFFKIGQQDPC